MADSGGEPQWYFSQVKGTTEDEVNEADIISTVEFNEDGELLATGDKGGRIVIFQREQTSKSQLQSNHLLNGGGNPYSMNGGMPMRTEYNVYSTFQSHEAEFDYLKSLEIEEKINKIKWLKRKNVAHFLLSTNDKTVKLWKIRERNKRAVMASADPATSLLSSSSSSNSMHLNGHVSVRDDINGFIRSVTIPVIKYMDRIEVEAIPKRIFANAHTYHINSISLNSDQETFMSADDLRINLWHIEITNQSFNIVDIKPANMEELTEVITAAEFHPKECNLFVYSSSKGIIRLCDMRQSALCDTQAKIFEEREDPTTKNFFSEIISSISDVKFSHSGRYLCTRDYLHVKVWDLNMENRPVETYCVHDYLRNKLCILYENDCIFDKFECSWSSNDDYILSGSYNNFFKSFNRNTKQELMFECSRDQSRPRQLLRPKRVVNSTLNSNLNGGNGNNQPTNNTNGGNASPSLNGKRNGTTNLNGKQGNLQSNYIRDDVNVDNLDFTKKILHTSWHPKDNIIAIAATNNLYIFYNKENSAASTPSSLAHYTSLTNTIMPLNNNTFNNTISNNLAATPAVPILTNSVNDINNSITTTSSTTTAPLNNTPGTNTLHKANQIITTLEETQQQDCSLTIPTSSAVITTCSQIHLSNSSIVTTLNNNQLQTNTNNQNLNSSFYTAPTSMTSMATLIPVNITLTNNNSNTATTIESSATSSMSM